MNISVATLPHFVAEVLDHDFLNLPRHVAVFCQRVPNFDFVNPHESLEQTVFVDISGSQTNVVLRHLESNLDAANKKIVDITPVENGVCNCAEDVKALKRKVQDHEKHIVQLQNDLIMLRETVNILSVCRSQDPDYFENSFVTIPKLNIQVSRAILDRALRDSNMNSGAELLLSDVNLWPMDKNLTWTEIPAPTQERFYGVLAFFADKLLSKSGTAPEVASVKKLAGKLRLHFQQVMRNHKNFLMRKSKRMKTEEKSIDLTNQYKNHHRSEGKAVQGSEYNSPQSKDSD